MPSKQAIRQLVENSDKESNKYATRFDLFICKDVPYMNANTQNLMSHLRIQVAEAVKDGLPYALVKGGLGFPYILTNTSIY